MKKRAADTELGGVDGLLILECFGERFRNEGTGMKCLIMKFNAMFLARQQFLLKREFIS